MREACEKVLSLLGYTLPQENKLFALHNTLLGVLAQKDYAHYTAMLEKLASHVVHQVQITSVTEEDRVYHTFACQREAKGGPIKYNKFSFRLKRSAE